MQVPDIRPELRTATPLTPSAAPVRTDEPVPADSLALGTTPQAGKSAALAPQTAIGMSLQQAATHEAASKVEAPAVSFSPQTPAARAAAEQLAQAPEGWNLASSVAGGRSARALSAPGLDPNNLDMSVSPRDDFFHYAVGGWIAKNPIPDELPRWGRFTQLAEDNTKKMHSILDEAAGKVDSLPGSNMQKLGDFYASAMDTAGIEAAGLTPLTPEFDRIAALQTPDQLMDELGHLQGLGVNAVFGIGATQDAKDNTRVIGEIGQGGLGLPDRDYYTKDDEKSQQLRAHYVDHVARMFALMGDSPEDAAAHAQTVMSMETRLARASMTRVEMRDPNATYHPTAVADLQTASAHTPWNSYLASVGQSNLTELNVAQPDFFKEVDAMVGDTPMSDWQTYLRWQFIDSTARALPQKFVDEDFNFKGTILNGTPVNRPRWKRMVASSDAALGDALGKEFVDRYFKPEAKERVREMVGNLKAALREDLKTLDWMSPETREAAIAKMDAFTDKIGYPDKWEDYSSLQIDRGPYVNNLLRARQFAFDTNLAKIGKPVDKTEWDMSTPTVNAYYNPLNNEIVFPAGILQPPFFDPDADDAVNYGAIGAVIGHEMTHGFDDQGAQFDGSGNLRDWWTDADKANFDTRTTAVENQFNKFEIEPGVHLNGKLVKGESIADLGGLTLAYRAFEASQKNKPAVGRIDGFTPEQRFFLGYAQVWAGASRPEYERMQVNTDPHPPARFRVNGTLQNMPEFAAAFGCQPGDPMVARPEDRAVIW